MYIVYTNNVCINSDNGTNDPEIVLLTSSKDKALKKAEQLINRIAQDECAFIDEDWDGTLGGNLHYGRNVIIFWDKQENWGHYTEVIISEIAEETEYL